MVNLCCDEINEGYAHGSLFVREGYIVTILSVHSHGIKNIETFKKEATEKLTELIG